MDDLTTRVERLETQVRRLLHLADAQRDPFIHALADIEASGEQESRIYELLNATEKRINDGRKVNPIEFESRVGEIMGDRAAGHATADSIVRTCEDSGRYESVVRALKATGWLG